LKRTEITEDFADASARWLYQVQVSEARRARVWRYSWTGINGALALSSFAAIPLTSSESHFELALSGVGSTISTFTTILWPLDAERSVGRPGPHTNPCEDLQSEEELASSAAADEASRVTWPWHVLNLAVGGVYFGLVGIGTHRWGNAVWDGVSAFAIGEAQLLTQPTRLTSRMEAYQEARNPRGTLLLIPVVLADASAQVRLVGTF
jgi:hypothetical protein